MREDVRKGTLNPEKAIETLKNSGVYSESMMNWLVKNGRGRYEKGIEEQARADESAKVKVKRESKQ